MSLLLTKQAKGSYQRMLSDGLIELSIYFLQSTSICCDVIILLSIYDVIESPPDTGGILVHEQAVDTRPTSLSEVRGLGSRLTQIRYT